MQGIFKKSLMESNFITTLKRIYRNFLYQTYGNHIPTSVYLIFNY